MFSRQGRYGVRRLDAAFASIANTRNTLKLNARTEATGAAVAEIDDPGPHVVCRLKEKSLDILTHASQNQCFTSKYDHANRIGKNQSACQSRSILPALLTRGVFTVNMGHWRWQDFTQSF
jgi:hypothetical protein